MKPNILVVDDEPGIRTFFNEFLTQKGFEVHVSSNWKDAQKILFTIPLDLVLLDLQLPGKDGLEILKEIKQKFSLLEVIIFSGKASVEFAVKSIKEGAFDFIEKSYSIEKILTIIENALKIKRLKEENIQLKKLRGVSSKSLIGKSKLIEKVREDISICAKTDSNVLITGENGTGKQIVAENIHYYSSHSDGRFVDINCAAVPENLLESEFFGYEKGAFTGAVSCTKGKFELAANKGTIFLDEIGEIPRSLQAKLLKVLENRTFNRLGGTELIQINARIIAATNIDIHKEIAANNFRKDLFYRLNVIHIDLPPLRARKEDIPLLVEQFLREIKKEEKRFTNSAMEFLTLYDWPGNIRELKNIVERVVIMTKNKREIERSDIEKYIEVSIPNTVKQEKTTTLKEYLSGKEKEYIKQILNQCNTQKEVSEKLGIERTVLYRKMKKYKIGS